MNPQISPIAQIRKFGSKSGKLLCVACGSALGYCRISRVLRAQMPFPAHGPRGQEKLDVILGQVSSLRGRLNSLALQYVFFLSLAIAVVAGAIVFVGAAWLSPLAFLITAGVTAPVALYVLWRAMRSGWRMRSNAARAAALADERAELKGRLTTIVQMVSRSKRGMLWAYLIEDALEHREEFIPKRIERRRISRSLWVLAASLIFAAALVPLAWIHPKVKMAANATQPDITVDLDDLHLRPAEPGDSDGLKVEADPATMNRLREKLAREGVTPGKGEGGRLGGLLDRARDFAGDVQRKLRGETDQKERLTLKLADNSAGFDQSNPAGSDSEAWRKSHTDDGAGQFKREKNPGDEDTPLPPIDNSLREPNSQASPGENPEGGQELGGQGDSQAGNDAGPRSDSAAQASGEQSSNGGSAHGVGADPDSLFGAATNSKMSTEGFEISIEARPMERGAKGAGQAYLPPKVRTPLNSHQEPDEPIARAAVPPDDRTTIQRVFDR